MSMYRFNNIEQGPNFDRARQLISTPFQYVDVALDTAGVNVILNISGDFLYLDASSTGVVTIELNNQYNDASAPFLAQPGFGLNALFKQVKLNWSAQQNKQVRIMYSTGDRVVPTNATTINGTVSIGNAVEVMPYGARNLTSFSTSTATALTANTALQIFDPSSNKNGAVLIRASMFIWAANHPFVSLIAKDQAPISPWDGSVLVIGDTPLSIGASYGITAKSEQSLYIPQGLGLYAISNLNANATTVRISCLYDLL